MAFYGLLLCGFHSNCTQYVWKPVASNAADELNQVQHHPAYLSLTRMMASFSSRFSLQSDYPKRRGWPTLGDNESSAKLLLPRPHGVRKTHIRLDCCRERSMHGVS
jgi:hypothetical protein